MKKYYQQYIAPLRPLLVLLLLSFGTTQAQKQNVKPGAIRVKVSEALAVSLETSIMTRSADNKLHTGIAALDATNASHGVSNMKRIFPYAGKFEAKHRKYGLHLWYEVVMDNSVSVSDAVDHYKNLDHIQKAEPIYTKALIGAEREDFGPRVVSPTAMSSLPEGTNDPMFSQQWHYSNTGQTGGTPHADINLLKAWNIESGKRNVVVAITDGGIDFAHEDLSDNIWVNTDEIPGNNIDDDKNGYVDDVHGYNFLGQTGTITPVPHGTHVAGTIAATTNNGIGVSGVAGGSGAHDGVQVMSCQVFDASGKGGDGFAMTYVYAADNGAVISQNSWGYTQVGVWEDAVLAGIDYFIAEAGKDAQGNQVGPMKGGIVIFAAGNSTSSGDYYPGYYSPVLSVVSTGDEDHIAYYSNYGNWTDISAPGGETSVAQMHGVLSTLPGNQYGFYQGTSMACPHVSGVAALVVSKFGGQGFTASQLREQLTGTTDYIDDKNSDFAGLMGTGRVNAFSALQDNDHAGPDAIGDLLVSRVETKSLTISFTAPADAGNEKAARYEVFYATSPITADNLDEANMLPGVYSAHEAGTTETITIGDLFSGTSYYVAVRSKDVFENYSTLSNVVQKSTYGMPVIGLSPESLSATLLTAETGKQQFTITNSGAGPLEFSISKDVYQTNFVSFSPAEGTVAQGKSLNVEVTFDAHKLFGGDYNQTLTIASNDSVTTNAYVALVLTVQDNNASIASLDPASYDFEGVYVGLPIVKTMRLFNDGSDTLRITGVTSNNARFTTDFSKGIKIPPFKEGRLGVTFKPTATAATSGVIKLTTNDPDHVTLQVAVTGHGVTPPAIAITPGSLSASLATGESATQTLTLKNTGANPLTYTAHPIPGKSKNVYTQQILIQPSIDAVASNGVQQKHPQVAGTGVQNITIKSARESSKPLKVLLISPDADVADFARLMAGFKDIALRPLQPDYLANLTAASLVNIDVIIITNNTSWEGGTTAEKAGDLLADYVDPGGKVVIGNQAYADDDYYKLKGRFVTEHYGPFEPAIGSAWKSVTLGDLAVPSHPLLEEVSELTYDGTIYDVGLTDGSTAIARWSTGELLVATNNRVVGINVLASVSSSYFPWTGDLPTLYHNAINWLAGSSMIRIDEPSGTLAAGSEQALDVKFDAADLVGGTYAHAIYLTTDVPGKQYVEVPATLTVRGPEFAVTNDSILALVGKGSKLKRTITLSNKGMDAHSYTVKVKDNGVAPPSKEPASPSNEESAPVTLRTKPYDGPAFDLKSSKIVLAKPATGMASSAPLSGESFSTDFESYVRGDISMSTDGWIGQYGNWTNSVANPAHGAKHFRGLADGYGTSVAQSPLLFAESLPYSTTTMKVNLKGSNVTWQIIPFSAVTGLVVTRLQISDDGTLQAMVDDGTGEAVFQPIAETFPEGYFNLTIESNHSTFEFKIYFDDREIFSGVGFAGDINGVLFYSGMEEAGPTLDIDDFFIIDGQKELLPNYINVSPESGTLAAGETKDITLNFDATEMPFGSYLSELVVDVERVEQIVVPMVTNVIGDANLTVDAVAYTEAYSKQDTLTRFTLHNTGGATLNYTMALSGADVSWLSLSNTEGSLDMRGELDVTVKFASKDLAPGTYTAKIIVTSNSVVAPERTLDVSLKVLTPPAVNITPQHASAHVATRHAGYQSITVSNTGESPLEFSFTDLFNAATIKAGYDNGEYPTRNDVSVLYATGFSDFKDWEPVDGQHDWKATSEYWQIYHYDVGEEAYDNHLTGTSQMESTTMAYSPVAPKGSLPMSSTRMTLYFEDELISHAMWRIIPQSVSANEKVTQIQINRDRSVQVLTRNEAGEEEFKIIPYKFPQQRRVELRVDVERATSEFVVYFEGVAMLHGQGFAGDIEQVAFFASDERFDYLEVDDLMIFDGVLPWLGVSPIKGTVLGGQSLEVKLLLDAQNLKEGTYSDALSVKTNDPLKTELSVEVDLTVTGSPAIAVDKSAIETTALHGTIKNETLTVKNTGVGDLNYFFSGYQKENAAGRSGGPDNYSYFWTDSDNADGPAFEWSDISTTGKSIRMSDNDNLYVDLPFAFNFYGIDYNDVSIISDGVLAFGPDQSVFEDEPNFDIPNPVKYNNFLAPYWEDLDPGAGGLIYYQSYADKFVIQYNEVPIFDKEEGNTFQAILYADGRIKYQYLKVDQTGTVTVGLENKRGTDGLQISYNKPYLKDGLAIMIQPAPYWVTPSVSGNTLTPGSNETVTMKFDATSLDAGTYKSTVFVRSDDFSNPVVSVPVTLIVEPSHTISGKVTKVGSFALEGIAFDGFPSEVITDALGKYTATVPENWSGTFKPVSANFTFSPAAITVKSLQRDMINQNFTGDVILGVLEESTAIKVYPNPSEGVFHVVLPNVANAHIEVYSTTGQLIMKDDVVKGNDDYVLHMTQKGLFVLVVQNKTATYVQRIVVR